jgi:aminopeptidase N
MNRIILVTILFAFAYNTNAQLLTEKKTYTRQDSLRGTVNNMRSWWDVLHYDINVTPDYASKTISGKTTIRYKVLPGQNTNYMQVDLQQPLVIDTVFYNNKLYINDPSRPYYNQGNAWFIPLPKTAPNSIQSITLVYHGKPREAKNAPWDGGWIWTKDSQGNPWMSVACQGLGASVWYPNKDHQSDEPDNGAKLTINIPEKLKAVGNGKMTSKTISNGIASYCWEVSSPINNYNIIPYIGNYVNWTDTLMGASGKLDLGFWVLQQDLEKAQKQFAQVKPMLRAFEYWFGPYPFYKDGYQLVQAPHLGMEHQSAVAYGNGFQNGYLGRDLSESGWGNKFDFIIVHESGHEWFGNNITTKDIADMWVHEGFTNYSETLFLDYFYGTQAGNEYLQGLHKKIANDIPIIGPYGVNKEGSTDMYYKGATMIHMIRQIINNDETFRSMLREMHKRFYHSTVTSSQVEAFISEKAGRNLSRIFDQYLRTTQVPVLELKSESDKIKFKWINCIDGFNMPVKLTNGDWIYPTTSEQKIKSSSKNFKDVGVDPNFYVKVKKG